LLSFYFCFLFIFAFFIFPNDSLFSEDENNHETELSKHLSGSEWKKLSSLSDGAKKYLFKNPFQLNRLISKFSNMSDLAYFMYLYNDDLAKDGFFSTHEMALFGIKTLPISSEFSQKAVQSSDENDGALQLNSSAPYWTYFITYTKPSIYESKEIMSAVLKKWGQDTHFLYHIAKNAHRAFKHHPDLFFNSFLPLIMDSPAHLAILGENIKNLELFSRNNQEYQLYRKKYYQEKKQLKKSGPTFIKFQNSLLDYIDNSFEKEELSFSHLPTKAPSTDWLDGLRALVLHCRTLGKR